ncbi:hypothetical protein [Dasania marina]
MSVASALGARMYLQRVLQAATLLPTQPHNTPSTLKALQALTAF